MTKAESLPFPLGERKKAESAILTQCDGIVQNMPFNREHTGAQKIETLILESITYKAGKGRPGHERSGNHGRWKGM